jgi:hypothetical protein
MATKLAISSDGKKARGYATPKEDTNPQQMMVPPRRVIPIIFLPGIMGSNLRMSSSRQAKLKVGNNAAWRPDKVTEIGSLGYSGAARRQLQLDPEETEVDTYEAGLAVTGSPEETADRRNDSVKNIKVALTAGFYSPLLTADPPHGCSSLTMEEKARARGWGEIFFSSYRELLETLEQAMNSPRSDRAWKGIVDVDPAEWMAERSYNMTAISWADLRKALSTTFFPVHAMGYNWLKSNADSALEIKGRINKLIGDYVSKGFKCEKVIVITHSMGGLVGRALAHPRIGGMTEKILGVVHGVLPANGAPAAYKRMRCGFEEAMMGLHPGPKIIGNEGHEVTAVLGNSPGGLQLLPNKAYGAGWLKIRQNGIQFSALPRGGDPYEEIYKVSGIWYELIRQEWLNPASTKGPTFKRTCRYLDMAREFHDELGDFYHPVSYAHYGADPGRASWEQVEWLIDRDYSGTNWTRLQIVDDDRQGELTVRRDESGASGKARYKIRLGPATGAGDQTVPVRSADHQFLRGQFQGVFRQTGYEHQDSYRSEIAIKSTLFSLVRIAQRMRWSDG